MIHMNPDAFEYVVDGVLKKNGYEVSLKSKIRD